MNIATELTDCDKETSLALVDALYRKYYHGTSLTKEERERQLKFLRELRTSIEAGVRLVRADGSSLQQLVDNLERDSGVVVTFSVGQL